VWGNLAGLTGVAVRSFAGTVLALAGVGLALAGSAYWFLRDHPWYGLLAAAAALAEALVAGVLLGTKRAVARTLAEGTRRLHLGQSLVRWLFQRLLDKAADGQPGERGETIARAAERVPLAQAEQRLAAVVDGLLGTGSSGDDRAGWFRRQLQRRLLSLVRAVTLARFRDEEARHGGVDLVKVRADLETRVDDILAAKLTAGLNLWTAVVLLALPAVVFVQTYVLFALLPAK
jgi:hypothetical protein